MKFGVREICNVVFKAKQVTKIGSMTVNPGQPVLYIDTATTSTMEGAATTVYAQGGRGNSRLIAWEGEKTLTFTVEDALLSPIGFAMLSGAGLLTNSDDTDPVHVHMSGYAVVSTDGTIDVSNIEGIKTGDKIDSTAPIYVMKTESDGSISGLVNSVSVGTGLQLKAATTTAAYNCFVDFYVYRTGGTITELQIDAENFAGYYYVEADTLFRRQDNGKDLPAIITFPNVKIQSNFTFSMASTGDPSTFTFTMDAFPGYTMFDQTKKVLCVIQVIDDNISSSSSAKSVMAQHTADATNAAEQVKSDSKTSASA